MGRPSAAVTGVGIWLLGWYLSPVCNADTAVLKNGDRLSGGSSETRGAKALREDRICRSGEDRLANGGAHGHRPASGSRIG